jgi:hypothetical protein
MLLLFIFVKNVQLCLVLPDSANYRLTVPSCFLAVQCACYRLNCSAYWLFVSAAAIG